MVERFSIHLVSLDPTVGSEIQKTRPCIVVSPNSMNKGLNTVIIAPMTTKIRNYPFRPKIDFQGKSGQVALDQIRTIDKNRLIKELGIADTLVQENIISFLHEMFV